MCPANKLTFPNTITLKCRGAVQSGMKAISPIVACLNRDKTREKHLTETLINMLIYNNLVSVSTNVILHFLQMLFLRHHIKKCHANERIVCLKELSLSSLGKTSYVQLRWTRQRVAASDAISSRRLHEGEH